MFKKIASLAIISVILTTANARESMPTQNKSMPFGQNLAEVIKRLEALCESIVLHPDQALEVPTATQSQTQIDCINYQPLQHEGVSEWIFADNQLDIVWVLSPLDTLEESKSGLSEKGIVPDYRLPGMADFYLERGFGYRYQPTEFLYFSDRLIPYYRAWLQSL
jgi:hypothetical protein